MWNPTSDKSDKKKEDDESFSSSSSVSSTSTGATTHDVGIFDKTSFPSASDTEKISRDAPVKASDSEQTDLEKSCEFSGDSGFISGPQASTIDDDTYSANLTGNRKDTDAKLGDNNLNSFRSIDQGHSDKTAAEISYGLDSGCIDECVEDSEPGENYIAAAAIGETSNNPMLLDKGVDSGISEWFCKINLNDQEQNSEMNNLGAPSTSRNTSKKQSSSSKKPANSTSEPTPKVDSSDAWEKFFQQNEDGDTPLHLACISGYTDVIAILIRMAPHPCLLNIQNDAVQTAMHLAALTRQPKILRMLIIAGAESCIRDHRGNTALHLACMSGDLQCVKALTIPISSSEINEAHRLYGRWSDDRTTSTLNCPALPADLELRNYDGERCVHLAAYKGHIDVLRHLINYGVDINAKEGKSGRTALHIAVETCNDTLANFLLEECSKVNLETETYAGLTAYQFACILDNSKMQYCLENHGAEPLTPPDSDYDSSDIETDLDDSQIYDRRFGVSYYFANYNGRNTMTVA